MQIYDILGVGFGPANLSLQIAFEECCPHVNAFYLEARTNPMWQKNMLIERSNIQHAPINDLVTHRNPRSRYTFINFLYEEGRLYEHYDVGLEYPLRLEYAKYVEWAEKSFKDKVAYEARATSVKVENRSDRFHYVVITDDSREFRGKKLVLATGRSPYIPDEFSALSSTQVIHLNDYLPVINSRVTSDKISKVAVIGSGQSAVEIVLDLIRRFPELDVYNYIRNFSYKLKDTNPFIENCIFQEHIETFYSLSPHKKRQWMDDIKYVNYSSADMDVIKELYLTLYENKLKNEPPAVSIINNSKILSAADTGNMICIESKDKYSEIRQEHCFDLVICATGFKDLGKEQRQEKYPPILKDVIENFDLNEDGSCKININYSLQAKSDHMPPIFLNGLCESTHGIADAGTFSGIALRTKKLHTSLTTIQTKLL